MQLEQARPSLASKALSHQIRCTTLWAGRCSSLFITSSCCRFTEVFAANNIATLIAHCCLHQCQYFYGGIDLVKYQVASILKEDPLKIKSLIFVPWA